MATDDFFCARLDQMIDLRHPLAVLAKRMPWAQIEAALAPALARKDRSGNLAEGLDLFGPTLQPVGAGVSAAGFNLRWLLRAIARGLLKPISWAYYLWRMACVHAVWAMQTSPAERNGSITANQTPAPRRAWDECAVI